MISRIIQDIILNIKVKIKIPIEKNFFYVYNKSSDVIICGLKYFYVEISSKLKRRRVLNMHPSSLLKITNSHTLFLLYEFHPSHFNFIFIQSKQPYSKIPFFRILHHMDADTVFFLPKQNIFSTVSNHL